jgi:hypothetical protein
MATQTPHVLTMDDSRVDCLVASIILNSFNILGIMVIMSLKNNYRLVLTYYFSNMIFHILLNNRECWYNIISDMILALIHLQLFAP